MEPISGLVIFVLVVALYFLPSIVAAYRGVMISRRNAIQVINLFFGWTLIGWLIALVMAFEAKTTKEYERHEAAEEAMIEMAQAMKAQAGLQK